MKHKAVVLGVLALVLIAGVAAYSYKHVAPESSGGHVDGAPRQLGEYTAAEKELRQAATKKQSFAPRKVAVGDILAGDTRVVALSEDERAWLENHHFLTRAEIEAAKSIPDETLKKSRTDALSQTLWGLRLLDRGDTTSAASVLENAASHGSIYAYEEAAVAQLKQQIQNNRGDVDQSTQNAFRARMEVAKIMGDHRADALFSEYFPSYDSQANAQAVQTQTTEFLRQLGANTQAQGTTSAGPDPRPNADLWANLQKLQATGGSADLISVYGP
ncbi:hypothetical protein [Xanthomonas tesorieronis]|uniref:hypothetical protein n=1 Tax=Xanthomonas tesorieronis TaxID=3160839 RepID=UPI003515F68D